MPRPRALKSVADYPHALALWHREKNLPLRPEAVRISSRKPVWWKCPKAPDHVWRDHALNRIAAAGCPFCAGKRLVLSNSFAGRHPELARQWHPTKNGGVSPTRIGPNAYVRAWWKCDKAPDHEWQGLVIARARHGYGCPFCSGRAASSTYNFAKCSPEYARLWHPTKNGTLEATDVTPGSERHAWFRCDRGHEWRTRVMVVNRGKGCPYCAGRKPAPDTSFEARHPRAAAYWHPTKNGALGPDGVTPSSNKVVWWRCSKGPDHEWQGVVSDVARNQEVCPFCSNRRVSVTNSLAKRFPRIAREWHPTRNGKVTPRDLVFGSHEQIWWQCPLAHVYRATPSNRTHGSGCPKCARLRKRRVVTKTISSVR